MIKKTEGIKKFGERGGVAAKDRVRERERERARKIERERERHGIDPETNEILSISVCHITPYSNKAFFKCACIVSTSPWWWVSDDKQRW